MVVRVRFMSGEDVHANIAGAETIGDIKSSVAEALRATPRLVQLVDDNGEPFADTLCVDLSSDLSIRALVFGTQNLEPDPAEEASDSTDPDMPALRPLKRGHDPDAVASAFWPHGNTCSRGYAEGCHMEDQQMDQLSDRCGAVAANSISIAQLPLHNAIDSGDCELLEKLVSDGAEIDESSSPEGDTALHHAAYRGNLDAVVALIRLRADPSAVDRKGKTPLRRGYDNKDVAVALLAADADPNSIDKKGCTTLQRAAEDGYVDVVQVLITARADPNLPDEDSLTALHIAAMAGNVDVVKVLLAARADVNARASAGDTALCLATQASYSEICHALVEAGAKSDDSDDATGAHGQQAGSQNSSHE